MKIKELELANNNLNSNCISLEHLIKHLNIEEVVLKLGSTKENLKKADDKDFNSRKNFEYEKNDDKVDYSSDENI